ncbi:Phosphatidylinositol 4-kinase pik1alpha (PI4-kinase)(PtdIns-4-kinase) [Coemansia erecta]|uniref:1-phosphatidylinositol 4-kinase n=1 Tax=Coemansia erecta TaxID=147472 RepID=A0A9W7Y2E4_9FUNG|nr:Phosphatidylinositol 4-kinase pik1alpha (PI4-kinase)(PtdIns-4-kinase) [Coemansia erecta]
MPASPAGGDAKGNSAAETSAAIADSKLSDTTKNSSLLLRLFTSQFFDTWLAVSYLFRYPNIVGVQHYLCNELRKFPLEEVEFFLPQLVHLLITRPNESIAVESLLLDMALQSSHIAMLLYWYLQAYLADLTPNPRTASFKHCQRIINQVQELLFTDIAPELIIDSPDPIQHAYICAMDSVRSTIPPPSRSGSLVSRFRRMLRLAPQAHENLQAAVVGIGSVAASAGASSLAPIMGWVAVAQGQSIKQPERIGEEPDLPPQHKMLSGKTRAPRAHPLSRSSSFVSERPKQQLPTKMATNDDSSNAVPVPVAANRKSSSLHSDSFERVSASQPATPTAMDALGMIRGRGVSDGSANNEDLESTDGMPSAASSQRQDAPESTPARPPKPSQRLAVGSRSPTPAERTSTDSCHTVAVMEDLQRAQLLLSGNDDATALRDKKQASKTRKSYLTKAAKEFQRNAKTLDRRLGRPTDGQQGASYRSAAAAATQESSESVASSLGGTCAMAALRETMSDMSTYMECERQKLERRTGYFGAEIKFMTTLMDISQRVCAVAKAGRQQFLKAELTLLNHALDRNTCIPLWCPDSDGRHHKHHRIVRIPTEDTVVLNSAERAPFLLTLEVIEPEPTSSPLDRPRSLSAIGDGLSLPPLHTPDIALLEQASNQALQSHGIDTAAGSPAPAGLQPILIDGQDDQVAVVSTTSPIQTSATSALSPVTSAAVATAEEVDEDLMTEVFGDLNDIAGVPSMPMSPVADRRLSGGFGSTRQRSQRPLSYIHASSPTSASRPSSDASSPHAAALPQPAAMPISTPTGSAATVRGPISRIPASQEDIRARMHTASVLLAQLARQQKALGIKTNNLVLPQQGGSGAGDSEGARSRGDTPETMKRRGKMNSATIQALTMEDIRDKLIREMMQLEELRLKQPGLDSISGATAEQDAVTEGDIDVREVEFKDDPSAKVLKEDWESKKARIRRSSPFGRFKNWNLLSVIVKEGADLRQEQLALQLIREMGRIWSHEGIDVFVKYYRIMVTGEGCGLMETITNTVSVHSIKKEFYSRNPDYKGPPYTLYNYFVTSYGTPDTERFREAQDNFMRSLVPYSLITYVLQIRDRHNGNILLDTAGHIIHIDFGFMLSNSPGSVGFEQAPFKFPMEYVDILGGRESAKFAEFRELLVKAFLGLRKHADNVCLLVEMMLKDSPLPCLSYGAATVTALRDRFHLGLSEQQAEELIDAMLVSSCDNITMRMYDAFQYYSNGIL